MPAKPCDVAIVGLSCRLPSDVNDLESLWDFCAKSQCAAGPFPQDRFNVSQNYHPDKTKPGHFHTHGASFLNRDVAVFDAPFFNISETEAKSIDPQHRLILETAVLALENAGIDLASISGRGDVGVFASGSHAEYHERFRLDPYYSPVHAATSSAGTMPANRVSYFLNLKGPSVTLDTACSSALSALHMAVESISSGECSCAIVGGSSLLLSAHITSIFSNLGTLGSDGKSYSFDHRATGYGRGEGSVCIILKSLSDAEKDRDNIRAIIKGSGINHAGRSPGITVPDGPSQVDLITRVYQRAGLDPSDTPYVEAHGTGTERGDPIEATSISLGFRASAKQQENPTYFGSVKSNFGHLEFVSGLVSVIKCIAMLERDTILPSANFEAPNPDIDLIALNLRVPTECIPWPQGAKRVSVNNFGFGGSNAHVIIEGPLTPTRETPSGLAQTNGVTSQTPNTPRLFAWCAKDSTSLATLVQSFAEWLPGAAAHDNLLSNLSYTLCCRRTHFAYRHAVCASTAAELAEKLKQPETRRLSKSNKAVFVFTGQGAQWPQMGRVLMQYQVFADAFRKAEKSIENLGAGWSLMEEVFKPAESSRINESVLSQPAVTALQIALVRLLRSWDLEPAAVCGHSSGEIAAAYAAGFLDLDSCMAIAYYRGEASSRLSLSSDTPGAMMAVGASPSFIEPYIASLQDGFATIACYNSPQSVTVSGDRAAILELSESLQKLGTFHRILNVGVAYHSDHMVSVAEYYQSRLETVLSGKPKQPSVPRARFYSSVNGRVESGQAVASPWYWTTNLVCPVQFSKAMTTLLSDAQPEDALSIIEIGPHSALKGPLREIVKDHLLGRDIVESVKPRYFSIVHRNDKTAEGPIQLAASLLNRGLDINMARVFASTSDTADLQLLTNLPQYPFNTSKRYWHDSRLLADTHENGSDWHMLLGHRITGTVGETLEFRNVFTLDDLPWLRGHVVNGEVLFPAAGYISMAIEALSFRKLRDSESIAGGLLLREISFGRALCLSEGTRTEIFTVLRPRARGSRAAEPSEWFTFQVLSWTDSDGFSEHCSGLITFNKETSRRDEVTESQWQLTRGRQRAQLMQHATGSALVEVSPKVLYEKLARIGLVYGSAFSQVSALQTGKDCAVGTVLMQDTKVYMPLSYETPLRIHPTTLDAILHVAFCNLGGNTGEIQKVRAHIPTFLQELFIAEHYEQQPEISITAYVHDVATEKMARTTSLSLSCFASGHEDELIKVRGLALFDVQEEDQVISSADTINPLVVEWRDSPDHVGHNCLNGWQDTGVDELEVEVEFRALEQQAYHLMRRALNIVKTEPEGGRHLSLMWKWMKLVVSKIESGDFSQDTKPWLALSDAEAQCFVDDVAGKSYQGQLNATVGLQLPKILQQQVDITSLLFERDGLWRIYDESTFFSRSNRQLAQLATLLGHQNASLRILEVGAGTGGLAGKILASLSPRGNSDKRRYEVYDYTDISTGFFDNARTKFANYPGVNFKKLDVSQDPVKQGFVESHYDLILAMDVLHATPDVEESLRNIRRLLAPGGVLGLVELDEFMLHLFPFATLPGWWEKDDGPIIKQKEWEHLLLASGFTGIDASIQDFANIGVHKVYWTHAAKSGSDEAAASLDAHLVQIETTSTSTQLAKSICTAFEQRTHQNLGVVSLAEAKQQKGSTIILDESASLLLDQMNSTTFEELKTLLYYGKNLLWVTRSLDPKTRFVTGFLKTLQIEDPHLRIAVLHLEPNSHVLSAADNVVKLLEQLSKSKPGDLNYELEFRELHGRIQIPRLVPAEPVYDFINKDTSLAPIEAQKLFQEGRHLELTIDTVGLLKSLVFQDSPTVSDVLTEDEVLIKIEATGLNFKDILIALGSLPWQGLGREASGVVVAAGEKMKGEFPIGSRVLHWGDNLIASHGRGTRSNTVRMPDNLTFEEAASIPVIFTTAYESLVNLARLEKGESILIHSAAGGVGQAAIMIAQWIGARVFCTVGSVEKKNLVAQRYGIPEEHIFSSRSPDFAQSLLEMTGMAGVDVILNSLAGDMLQLSWRCVAELGRFIDISKRDAVANSHLEMAPFDKGITYVALDLSKYPDGGTKGRGRLTRDVLRLFETGAVRPVHPVTSIHVSELESAFKLMQVGKHMGKIVIRNEPDAVVRARGTGSGSNNTSLLADATYIVTGGGTGLGYYLAQWLLDHGAQNLVLSSRSILSTPQPRVAELAKLATAKGGKVLPVACDVSSLTDVERMVDVVKAAGMPPIKGVIHGAMVLKDAMFDTTTYDDWQKAVQPKVWGTINLHRALRDEPLDFFICLSSLVGILGNAGQSSYAGSNAFIDAFCEWRVGQGLPAASVALPAISDVGYVFQGDPTAMRSGDLFDFRMTGDQVGHLVKAALNFQHLGSHIVAGASRSLETAKSSRLQNPLLSQVKNDIARMFTVDRASHSSGIQGADAQPLVDKEALSKAASVEEASRIVFQAMVQKIAKDMMIAPQDIMPDSSLAQLGLDSLVAVEFRNWLAEELKAKIRVLEIISSNSLYDLVARVVQQSTLLVRFYTNGEAAA